MYTPTRDMVARPCSSDQSRERLEWGRPDLDLLRLFCLEHFNWHRPRTDELLLPVLKLWDKHDHQSRIDSFFTAAASATGGGAPRPFTPHRTVYESRPPPHFYSNTVSKPRNANFLMNRMKPTNHAYCTCVRTSVFSRLALPFFFTRAEKSRTPVENE